MIDICDFAVGLSRQLYGLTIASERPGHRMYEQWHPLGPSGVITAFNFPVAVWSWNARWRWSAATPVVWKPSEKTPLTAIACTSSPTAVWCSNGVDPAGSHSSSVPARRSASVLVDDPRLPLVSATGSCADGPRVGEASPSASAARCSSSAATTPSS
jgi:aldehyde dehydrogenase (NAD+)